MWTMASYACWAASAVLALWMIADWYRVDTTFSEDVLTSSREGEIEAETEQHKL